VMPSVRDLWTYGETGFHSLAAAVVQERYGREALVSGFRILGEGQLSLTKFLILTDTPQDLSNFSKLLEHVLGEETESFDRAIDVHVSRLKKRLATVSDADLISCYRGVGYRLDVQHVAQ